MHIILIAKDWKSPENDEVTDRLQRTMETRESLMGAGKKAKQKLDNPMFLLFSLTKMSYDEFTDEERKEGSIEAEFKPMSVVIMTEMSEIEQMNAVYKRAKKSRMRVMIAMPPDNDHWFGMVDASDGRRESEEKEEGLVLINEEMRLKLAMNDCSDVDANRLGIWIRQTVRSMAGSVMIPELGELYAKHNLLRPHWCLSGICLNNRGFLDRSLGFGSDQVWRIENCSVEEMTHAVFTSNDELIIVRKRARHRAFFANSSLFALSDAFKIIDLKTHPFKCEPRSNGSIHCSAGDIIEFDASIRSGWVPFRFNLNPEMNVDLMQSLLLECMKPATIDHAVRCLVAQSIAASRFGNIRSKSASSLKQSEISKEWAWMKCIQSFVEHNPRLDLSYLPSLLSSVNNYVDLNTLPKPWTIVLPTKRIFEKIPNPLKVFKLCLFAAGLGGPKQDAALKWAINIGDSRLVTAAIAYEKSLHSQSTLEDEMAEKHARWSAQSEYFVQRYLLKKVGGKEAISVLIESLNDFIRDRGDFTAVDLMGIVWHSDDEAREALLRGMMSSMKTILDYNSIHENKIGWNWVKHAVMKHPVWLCECEDAKDDSVGDLGDGREDDDGDSGDSPILFGLMKNHCEKEAETKGGRDIADEFAKLIEKEPEQWNELTNYKPEIPQSGHQRQDCVEGGTKARLTKKEIRKIAVQTNTLDFNAEKEYDSKSYLTEVLLDAHFVQPHFQTLMKDALSEHGKVQIGPVKQASRVLPKSEEYASEDKPHCHWPYSACVIDLIRCSVTVNTLKGMMSAMRAFESYLSEHPLDLSLVRCKNGFGKFAGKKEVPSHYTDVKMNVACKDESGTRCVIGEVQFLLQCILDSKKKGHELYEVTRSMPLYKGAAKRMNQEWSIQQQLLLTIDNSERMRRLLTFFPFKLTRSNIRFSYLFRSRWTNPSLIDALAEAIVHQSGENDVSKLSFAMMKSVKQMPNHHPLPVGTIRLMCHIIRKAGSEEDSLVFIRRLLAEMSGTKCFVRALVGLEPEIKKQLRYDLNISQRMGSKRYHDITAVQLVSVFEDWNEHSLIDIWRPLNCLFRSMWRLGRVFDPKDTVPAVQRFYVLNPDRFLSVCRGWFKGEWEKKLPDYMVEVASHSLKDYPAMVDGFVDQGWIVRTEDGEDIRRSGE